MAANLPLRAAPPSAQKTSLLGPLAELEGAWIGRGFNLIAVPNRQQDGAFRLILNATMEQLEFTAIASPVPDRGSAQDDIFLYGYTYRQQVNDANTLETLHIESGMWLNVPATTEPQGAPSVVRQSSIPHGNVLLAQGSGATVSGKPDISPVYSTPTGSGELLKRLGYLDPYLHSELPAGMKQLYVANMNQALMDAMEGQNVLSNVLIDVATLPEGGIVSIPFAGPNAAPTKMKATFWIETVQRPDGSQFLQLQYSQTVVLNFLGIDWPHISVGTLIKT